MRWTLGATQRRGGGGGEGRRDGVRYEREPTTGENNLLQLLVADWTVTRLNTRA